MFSKILKSIRLKFLRGRHRSQRLMANGLAAYIAQQIGDYLYSTGFTIERSRKHFFRSLRKGSKRCAAAVGAAATAAGDFIWNRLKMAAKDISSPFVKAVSSAKSLVSVMDEMKDDTPEAKRYRLRSFFANGLKWNKPMLERFASYVLPVVCGIICFAVINSVLSLNYVVAVTCNGTELGYVADEAVYDSAKSSIDNRIVNTGDERWSPSTILTISVADEDELMDESEMTRALLISSGSEICEATGLYVGGTFYGATTAGELLSDKLDNNLEPYRLEAAEMGKDITVRYARKVELREGIYNSDAIRSFSEMCDMVDSNEVQNIYYNAEQGESVSQIAYNNNITVSQLQELNPDAKIAGDYLTEKTELLVAEDQQLLSVKMVGTITKVTKLGYRTEVVRDDSYPLGYYNIGTQGVEGERITVTEIEYQDGVEINRVVVSDKVTQEPINQYVVVGTGGTSGASTPMLWPVACPPQTHISRGFTAGYHLGIDIWSPKGTPIYAAEDGVVVVATQMVWDYGIYCIVDHGNNVRTVYGHCSALLVETGDVVKRGQVIALMGTTGNSTGNHLHFEVRINGVKVDPQIYIS